MHHLCQGADMPQLSALWHSPQLLHWPQPPAGPPAVTRASSEALIHGYDHVSELPELTKDIGANPDSPAYYL